VHPRSASHSNVLQIAAANSMKLNPGAGHEGSEVWGPGNWIYMNRFKVYMGPAKYGSY